MSGKSKKSHNRRDRQRPKSSVENRRSRQTESLEEEAELYDEDEGEVSPLKSPREEGEAFSEEGEASSDDVESAYRRRLAKRKAQREAQAAAEAATLRPPPRSKFESPSPRSTSHLGDSLTLEELMEDSSYRLHKSASSSVLLEPRHESTSASKRMHKSGELLAVDAASLPSTQLSSSHRHHKHSRHHHKANPPPSSSTEPPQSTVANKSPSPSPSARNRSRSPLNLLSQPTHQPSGVTSSVSLPPGRAPIIDGSQFKYLEEEEDDDDDDGVVVNDDENGPDTQLVGDSEAHNFSDNIVRSEEDVQAGLEDILAAEDSETLKENLISEPAKPFYLPSVQGCRSVDEFECLNRIEEGTYGVVYRARDKKTNEVVALKRLKMEKEREGFPITSLREINTLMKAQHENIVTVREIVVGFDLDKIYLVMEYVEHDMKSLMEVMSGPFTVGQVKCLLIQLLCAVSHMHDNWILHRDLKTSNLLLSHKGILKVGDFGLAREYGSPLQHYTEVVVTLWYRAIELLLGTKSYSTPIDLWSVGCIFAEFLLQRPLFPGKGEVDEINMIFRDLGTPNERIWPGCTQLPGLKNGVFTEYPYNQLRRRFTEKQISDSGFDLLGCFLTYCPDRRITAEKAINHRYFKERPHAIHPSMMPSWPAKSEGGSRPQRLAAAAAAAAAASSRPAASAAAGSSTHLLPQEPPAPLGASRFFSRAESGRSPITRTGSGMRPSGPDQGFMLRF